jgi:hypothetical protein
MSDPTADRLRERFAIELESYTRELSEGVPNCHGICTAHVPWCRDEIQFRKNEAPQLIVEVGRLLQARAWFATAGPAWAQPLPLGDEEWMTLIHHGRGAMYLLGLYSVSLQECRYDYIKHPSFHAFGCGMMAHPDAPEHVRGDAALAAEFPAKPLPGLGGRGPTWSSKRAKQLQLPTDAEVQEIERRMQAMMAMAHKAPPGIM